MRKSQPLERVPNGNAAKFLSYREAWTRVNDARAQGFYLEAVTLLESIITDRLIAYLLAIGNLDSLSASGKRTYPPFGQLIDRWMRAHPEPIAVGRFVHLQVAIDEWRIHRNQAIHGIVRVEHDTTALHIGKFLTAAADASEEGDALAKALTNWSRRAIRAAGLTSSDIPCGLTPS